MARQKKLIPNISNWIKYKMLLSDKIISHCDEKAKIITCNEHNKIYKAINIDFDCVYFYHIDGEVIVDGARCDYMLENGTKNNLYFIELKGKDVAHAIDQISNTVNFIKNIKSYSKYKMKMRIVCKSNTHNVIASSSYRNFKKTYPDSIVRGYIEEDI